MKRLVAAAAGSLVAVALLSAPAYAADLPPQEPGVTLRTYDTRTPLEAVCTLKPGQTPNVDKLMSTIDYKDDQFGLVDNFVSHVLTNLNVPAAGAYEFKISSDDGALLYIDDNLIADNDGRHGVTSVEATVELSAGYHPLRIEYFEHLYGAELRLEWRPPGTTDFVLVPTSVLSTEADVVRVTAPGQKQCEGELDTPGDGLPLDSVNPDYTLTNLRPPGFEPQVTGMAWMPDGRMVITVWGNGSSSVTGEVYIVDGVTGATDPSKVTYKKVIGGLREPMGVAVVDGLIYVSQKHELTELQDTNGDEVADATRTVATWPYGGNFHEFAFGLLYKGGNFYINLSVAINLGGASTNPQPAPGRGTTIMVNKRTGKVTTIAGGLRTPHGIGFGPENELLVTDNQGDFLPASKLLHIQQDQFFHHLTNPAGPYDTRPVTQPVLWMPQNEIANSPSTPILVKKGQYKGQLLIGDVTYGGLQRAYLEKVKGQYQGALFRHTQGLESGITRVSIGPDGDYYVGGLGAGGNWGQEGKLTHGLQKLTPTGANTFDMKSMSAVAGGFAIEYTRPLSTATIQDIASKYQLKQWRYAPTPQYGGPKIDEQDLRVTGAKVSNDRKKVTIQVEGLQAGHVVYLRSPRPFAAANGQELFSTEAWYTLNNLVGPQPDRVFYDLESGRLGGGASVATEHAGYDGGGFVAGFGNLNASTTTHLDVTRAGAYDVGLRYSNGPNPFSGNKTISLYLNGAKVKQLNLPSTDTWKNWATATERLTLKRGVNEITYRVDAPDTGHVNLDGFSVRKPGERITLFDGKSLAEWQHTDGRAASWLKTDGEGMEVRNGDLRTKQAFGDYKLHVEFKVPLLPPEVTGQDRGNSGVYQQERYELQILDSFGDTTPANNEAGAIYTKAPPLVNAAKAPEQWQTYDITFRAARFDAAGAKTENARITVVWNGVTVHDNFQIDGGTGGNIAEGPSTGSIRLQDHGNKVQYRNIWIEPA